MTCFVFYISKCSAAVLFLTTLQGVYGSPDSYGPSPWLIAGLVLGAPILIFILIALCGYCRNRRLRSQGVVTYIRTSPVAVATVTPQHTLYQGTGVQLQPGMQPGRLYHGGPTVVHGTVTVQRVVYPQRIVHIHRGAQDFQNPVFGQPGFSPPQENPPPYSPPQ